MMVLGIESTAHTLGVAILDGKKILSNIRDMATTKKGGMIPTKVAEHHEDCFKEVIDKAFAEASKETGMKISWKDIELIAVSNAPGMGHA
ncbi:UGMP family protein, partial [Candidatus Woesearchaeota archaeon]|nr:UGMP family protein [Candidatus Woesearchaeota archaeon]